MYSSTFYLRARVITNSLQTMKTTCLIFFFLVTLTTQAQLTFISGGRTVSVAQNKATYHVSGQKWGVYVNDQRKALRIALDASKSIKGNLQIRHQDLVLVNLFSINHAGERYYHLKLHNKPELGLIDYYIVEKIIINYLSDEYTRNTYNLYLGQKP